MGNEKDAADAQAQKKNAINLTIRKIKALHNSLENMKRFASKFNAEVNNFSQIQIRLEELAGINQAYQGFQDYLEMLNEINNENECLSERNNFEEKLFDVKAILKELLDQKESCSINSSMTKSGEISSQPLRLPTINAPNFDGNLQEWSSFKDSFDAMFHLNSNLAPVQKFHYLKSCLSGPASDVVKSVPITNDNYKQAYDKLIERYENPGLIIQSHIRALFDTPKVQQASASQLHKLHHHIITHVRALQSLNQPIDQWDAWLVTLLCCRLDSHTVSEWQLRQTSKSLPSFNEIEKFLSNRVIAYEAGDTASGSAVPDKTFKPKVPFKQSERRVVLSSVEKISYKCVVCSGNHKLYKCDQFRQLSVRERVHAVSSNSLCFKCLYPGHMVRDCKWSNCPICNRWHNKLLHDNSHIDNRTNEAVEQPRTDQAYDIEGEKTVAQVMYVNISHSQVILATAVVYLSALNGEKIPCRAVLDSGSQVNFVTKECAQKLGLPVNQSDLTITGIGQTGTTAVSAISVEMQSQHSNCNMSVDFYVLPSITTNLPTCQIDTVVLNIPHQVKQSLADPNFDQSGIIDLLLGADIFYKILEEKTCAISNQAAARSTSLGWIITGKVPVKAVYANAPTSVHTSIVMNSTSALSLFSTIKNVKHQEELDAESHFTSTMSRDDSGKFVVRLPFKQDPSVLGDSKCMASKRFFNLERKFMTDVNLANHYKEFMSEYLNLGHMELVTHEAKSENSYYLPHHAVIKNNSLTTKTRVVFDASASTTSGLSLNDILLKGPTVQPTLVSTLLRFRTNKIALSADVEKMYRQVLISTDDWHVQKILYRSSPMDSLLVYKLTTVTYGTKSASYLATRCLSELGSSAPTIKSQNAICNDFYVDDLLSGGNTEDECYQLFKEVSSTLSSAGFHLRKWCTNSEALLSRLPSSQKNPNYLLQLNEEDTTSTLGITWSPHKDCFKFVLKPWIPRNCMTKRTLLSEINQVYDPLGFLSPVLISGKVFLQQLWAMKLGWDTQLPPDIQRRWTIFYKSLEQLQCLNIPRVVVHGPKNAIQLHGFCDASQQAFGACVYVRSSVGDDHYSVLLTSKSRVAPMKQTTIPRLELCGAVLLADLVYEIIKEFKRGGIHVAASDVILWTDSTIVLAWIRCIAPLKPYVANRVAQILDQTVASQWRHVAIADNPADVISRGIEATTFRELKQWWNGPTWLTNNESVWPASQSDDVSDQIPELRTVKLSLVAHQSPKSDLLDKYSNWMSLVRVTAWIKRFVFNARIPKHKVGQRNGGSLTADELLEAKICWLRYSQEAAFKVCLRNKQPVAAKSSLKALNPFLDDKGLIRVGGRLAQSFLPYSQRHPILLPPKSKITRLLFEYEHCRLLHVGAQALLAFMHSFYWPLRRRTIARSVVHKCIVCYRSKPTLLTPLMAPLPRERVTVGRPFSRTGVDYCGPILIRSGVRRVVSTKCYISVFVCLTTRAIHLELVTALTSEAFLAALSRFMSRRGHCHHIYSDNGTNFVGANKILKQFLSKSQEKESIKNVMAEQGVQWHFIPPASPHFGGMWEAAVKSAKHHLFKVTKGALLTFEEMNTLLYRIEAILNSRPMTPLSSSPSDFEPLTPGHFLVGGQLTVPAEPDMAGIPSNRLRRLELVRAQTQVFWRRWSNEYLPQLHKRSRWVVPTRNLKVGDLVILKEDGTPPMKWKLGRVKEVYPGQDDTVRVVSVVTASGALFKRPVVKLSLLPTYDDEEECQTD